MAPVPVKVKLLKEMYHVDVDVDDNPIVFREAVEAACGVPPGKFLKMTDENRSIFENIQFRIPKNEVERQTFAKPFGKLGRIQRIDCWWSSFHDYAIVMQWNFHSLTNKIL